MHFGSRLRRVYGGAALTIMMAAFPWAWAVSPVLASRNLTSAGMNSHAEIVDINTATVDQLKALPGMGIVYAERIIANRPYHAKNQLVTKGVLPQGEYDRIKDEIVAHRVKK